MDERPSELSHYCILGLRGLTHYFQLSPLELFSPMFMLEAALPEKEVVLVLDPLF